MYAFFINIIVGVSGYTATIFCVIVR